MTKAQPSDSRFSLIYSDFKSPDSESIVVKTNSADAMSRIIGMLCAGDWIYKSKANLVLKDRTGNEEIVLNDFDTKNDMKLGLTNYLKRFE